MADPTLFAGEDDSDYRAWLRDHSDGQVVNGLDQTGRRLTAAYRGGPVWHRATCAHIGGSGSRMGQVQSYTLAYPKACWGSRAELEEWRARPTSPELWWCQFCGTEGRRE